VRQNDAQRFHAQPAPSRTTRVGVTGHLDITDATARRVATEMRRHLLGLCRPGITCSDQLVGVTCLAKGADSIFAQVLIELGGRLEVIVPAANYREIQNGPDPAVFDAMLRQAASVRTMPAARAEEKAYVAANHAMLDAIDELIAIWDGVPAGFAGGTAAVVRTARDRDIPVTVIWPDGAQRR
jgi:hypothetical protein